MKMTKEEKENAALRKAIGLRFKQFRESIKKSQSELANELEASLGIITSIESGKCYPGFSIQNYLYVQYHLNLNWLLAGKGGMLIPTDKDSKNYEVPIQLNHIDEDDPRYERYVELKSLLRIPVIEKIIFGKLAELKIIAEEEIKAFFEET
jgi:transcriptional regulator with XRE-family HTH domain